ncbi:hypothetical protein LXL04_020024 [Taraxacum kok-saghyz]
MAMDVRVTNAKVQQLKYSSKVNQDRVSWNLEKSGIFTVSSLRRHIDDLTLPVGTQEWNLHRLVPRKVNILAWRTSLGRLPTKTNLTKRGIATDLSCSLCNSEDETENHLFLQFPIVKEVWNQLQLWWKSLPQLPSNISDLTKWVEPSTAHNLGLQAAMKFTYIWVMWLHMNKNKHENILKSQKNLASEIQTLSHL